MYAQWGHRVSRVAEFVGDRYGWDLGETQALIDASHRAIFDGLRNLHSDFDYENTGGGCMAYRVHFPHPSIDGHTVQVLVTSEETLSTGCRWDFGRHVTVGAYLIDDASGDFVSDFSPFGMPADPTGYDYAFAWHERNDGQYVDEHGAMWDRPPFTNGEIIREVRRAFIDFGFGGVLNPPHNV